MSHVQGGPLATIIDVNGSFDKGKLAGMVEYSDFLTLSSHEGYIPGSMKLT